ncbi:uncharacterized protein LOC136027391 [Artemia franciscana]|uniref:uncharacterized protein LOC136027391 n=1 Tax=Artemia franciscana TaxID=6661 RepID=UPI0032DAA7FA
MKSKEDLVNLSDEVASWSVNIAKDRKESTKAADEESSVLIGSQLNKLKDTVPDGVETLKMTVASAGDAPTTRLEKTSEATTNGISKAIVSAAVPLARLFERNKDYVYSCDQANEQLSLGHRKSQNKANFEEETNKINENDEKSSIFRKMDDFLFRRKNRNGSNTERLKKAGIISEIFGYQNLGKEEESKALKRWMGLGKDPKSLRNITRDINGNTDLHFAVKDFSGRIPEILSHRNSSFFVVARNLNYKTARDMAKEIGNEKSVIEIDSYVIGLVKKGEIDSLTKLFMEGYDHVSDIVDPESGRNIMTVAEEEGNRKSVLFLRGLVNYEENRNIIHTSIRLGQLDRLKVLLNNKRKGKLFAVAKDKKGRCSLHVAVLAMHLHKLEMINYLCREFPYTVAVQDNLGRTPLHYAYGLGEDSEEVIYILEAVGAKNSVPDYLQRTPLDFSELQSEIYKLAKEEQDEI